MSEPGSDPSFALLSKVTNAVTGDDLRENLATPVLRTLRHLLGVPEHFTGMMFDWIAHIRAVNLAKFSSRLDALTGEKGINCPLELPSGPVLSAINTVSLQADEDLQNCWAEMLSKAMDPTAAYSLKMAHVATLSEMDALDARIVDLMCRRPCTALANCIIGAEFDLTGTTKALLICELSANTESYNAAHSNLVRLGVIGLTGMDVTPFGQSLWQAVTPAERHCCSFGFTDLDRQWRDLWVKTSASREEALKNLNMYPSNDMFSY